MNSLERARRYAHRRARLLELLDALAPAPRAWFAAAIKRPEDYVARLLTETKHRKNIGDEMMSAITKAFSLDPGWFDLPLGTAIPHGVSVDSQGRVHRRAESEESSEPKTTSAIESIGGSVAMLRRRAQSVSASDRRMVARLIASYIEDDDASESQLEAIRRLLGEDGTPQGLDPTPIPGGPGLSMGDRLRGPLSAVRKRARK